MSNPKLPSGPRKRSPLEAVVVTDPEREARLKRLAYFLDEWIPLPGGYRIGLDGLLGLIPGVGDWAGAALSSYIIWEAARMGASKRILLRMVGNVAVETAVGVVPVLGDIFDFAWKANSRNLRLLRDTGRLKPARRPKRILWLIGAALLIGVVILSAAIGALVWWLLSLFA